MKVQALQQQNSRIQNPQFKGVADVSLRYLATNQAVGANSVDFCFMVAPRTASDGIKRGPAAGAETFRREIMGTVNDSCLGLFGAGAGALLALSMKDKFGLNVNHLFTAPETLNILAENKAEQLKNNKSRLEYIRNTFKNIKAYNPTSKGADKEGFVKLSDKTIKDVSKIIDDSLTSKVDFHTWTKKKTPNNRQVLINKIIENTGAESRYILESADKKTVSNTNLKSLLNDIYIVSHSFDKPKVKDAFVEQIKGGKGIQENTFIKGLSKFMKTRAGVGFAVASALGLSVQPINMYLTKLKTGSDGFVGVEGRSKDNSAGFMGLKTLSSAAFFSMVLTTLELSPLKFIKSPGKFMEKMSFTGKMPTINQLKGVYGITIISRIFSARDKDELREVLTKDTLGYLSWLVLGDFVNKLAADQIDKSVINYKDADKKKGAFKRAFGATLKTRDEILIETLAQHKVDTTKMENGKLRALKFSEMLKELKENPKITDAVRKTTRKRLSTLNKAQISGYLFSGLVLGLGIPNLNIYVTNMLDKKRKAAAMKQSA